MSTVYEINDELQELVEDTLGFDEFDSIRANGIQVLACMKTKVNEDGELVRLKGDSTQVKRVTGHYTAFIDKHFILTFDGYVWANAPELRTSGVHRALMRIVVRVNDAGTVMLGTRLPDVQDFSTTIRRYGSTDQEIRAMLERAALRIIDVVELNPA